MCCYSYKININPVERKQRMVCNMHLDFTECIPEFYDNDMAKGVEPEVKMILFFRMYSESEKERPNS